MPGGNFYVKDRIVVYGYILTYVRMKSMFYIDICQEG
jgi:hypothetical protein